jgi:phosphoribosylanthranilate isomerase
MVFLHEILTFAQKYNMSTDIMVKISGVFNLTDARFYAAAGADFIGFCIDEQHTHFCDLPRIKEIVSWLEGPSYVLETYVELDEDKIDFYLQETGIRSIHTGPNTTSISKKYDDLTIFREVNLSDWNNLETAAGQYLVLSSQKSVADILTDDIDLLTRLCLSYTCFLDLPWQNSSDVEAILSVVTPVGLVFHGSAEEKTGLKNFDWMEEVFEMLGKS